MTAAPSPAEPWQLGRVVLTGPAAAPDTVQVGPWTVRVAVDQAVHDRVQVAERSSLFGHWEPETLTISVQPGLPRDQEADTVLHEVLHAITDAVGLTATPGGDLADQAAAERIVAPLATALLDTLRRNPQLVDYLTGR